MRETWNTTFLISLIPLIPFRIRLLNYTSRIVLPLTYFSFNWKSYYWFILMIKFESNQIISQNVQEIINNPSLRINRFEHRLKLVKFLEHRKEILWHVYPRTFLNCISRKHRTTRYDFLFWFTNAYEDRNKSLVCGLYNRARPIPFPDRKGARGCFLRGAPSIQRCETRLPRRFASNLVSINEII